VLYRAAHPTAQRFGEAAVRAALLDDRRLDLPPGDVLAAGTGTGVAAAVRVVSAAGPGPSAGAVLVDLVGRRGPR
jgi:hypothetical protein